MLLQEPVRESSIVYMGVKRGQPFLLERCLSRIHFVVGLQYSNTDLGYHDFHYILHYYSFLNRKNVSPEVFLGAEFDRDIQNWAKVLGTV